MYLSTVRVSGSSVIFSRVSGVVHDFVLCLRVSAVNILDFAFVGHPELKLSLCHASDL